MEIHIILAGERVGPLSEMQLREYLGQGLVSTSDLAYFDGMDNWQPLDLILPHLTASTPGPDPISTDIASTEPPASADAVEKNEPALAMTNDTTTHFEPFELTAVPPPTEPIPPLTATQKTKRKMSKIVIQPILPLEPTTPMKKKPRTGKLPVTLEPLRPTTSLPPVVGYAAKDRKPTRTLIRPTPPNTRNAAEKPVATPASETVPVNAPALIATHELPPPFIAPTALESTHAVPTAKSWFQRIPRNAMIYAGAALALLILCVIFSTIYLVFISGPRHPETNPVNPVTEPSVSIQAATPAPPTGPQTASDYSDRGMSRQAKGDLDGAISDYNQSLTLDPKNSEAFYRRGLARQAKGDFNGALADDTQVIALNPKRANAFSNRGFIKQALGDADGALADYAQALLLDPKIPGAYYNEGLIEVQKGNLDSAIAAYDNALNLDPKMAVAYYNRGVAKNTEGNVEGAIADYTQALTLNPKIALAYSNRGFARQAKGDIDGALADYTQALALNPKLADAFYNRGLIELQKGDLDGAIDDSTQAINLDSKNGQAYFTRGQAQLGKGKLDAALSDLKSFCDVVPTDNSTDVARLYIWVISTVQDPDGTADETLSTALQNTWNSTPEDLTSKIAAFLLGHVTEGDLIANAATPDPSREPGQYCKVWYFAGMKRLLSGDTATAIGYFQKSVATNRKDLCEYIFAQTELQALAQNREIAAKPDAGPQ